VNVGGTHHNEKRGRRGNVNPNGWYVKWKEDGRTMDRIFYETIRAANVKE